MRSRRWLGLPIAAVVAVLALAVPVVAFRATSGDGGSHAAANRYGTRDPFGAVDPQAVASHYRALALRTQQYTEQHLAYFGGAANCPAAPYVSYRRDLEHPTIADAWYVALQIRADAALVRLGEDRFACHMTKAVDWLELLWDPSHQGYAPRADLDGSNPTLRDVYADDNAVIGLAYIEVARVTRDPALRERLLAAADRAARYPLVAGLWDETSGGLWWNNQRAATGEGKPAQTTALLAQVMAELYAETGNPYYRDEAVAALDWLDRTLWDESHHLYAYAAVPSSDDPSGFTVTWGEYFGYDQAIVIDALLALHRADPGDGSRLTRAQEIARATDRAFWHRDIGGYTLQAGVTDLYAPYGVWISESLLHLYAVDGDPFWLERARANFDTIEARFRDGDSGAYFRLTFPCTGERVSLCRPGEQWGYDRVIYSLSQAMMQRVAALLAAAS
ncbi:MAG: AGE family epimerase/isomerase [Chloroflexi bacterium]|nr:AGE family epimerase/isomerase [Chloroflexota bacterium]